MIDNKLSGKKIAALRQSRGMTQQQLAAILGVSHQAVSKWESGAALPDIQTMIELTRFFGITVEQLVCPEIEEEIIDGTAEAEYTEENKEMKYMNIQQLLQMAPFMSKEAVEEIAMTIEGKFTAQQLARLAPHLRPEGIEALIEKHGIELTWETLKRIAPFMSRETVDELARKVACGEKTIGRETDRFDKAMNDIGKAFDAAGKDIGKVFDDIGKGVEKAFNKAVKFGEEVINDVSEAFSEREKKEAESSGRSERMLAIRKKAFERAMADEKWDWIAAHLGEIEGDGELKAKIAECACACGKSEWVCEHMGAYADAASIEKAIAEGNWEWLSECAWLFSAEMQHKTALAAMEQEKWKFLSDCACQLNLDACALQIAKAALMAGERELAAHLAGMHLSQKETMELLICAATVKDGAMLDMIVEHCDAAEVELLLDSLAKIGNWKSVEHCLKVVSAECIEHLMDIAVDQGNFDAIDMLDSYA